MGNSVTTDQINPTQTNTEKKHWWITIQLARLLNYLSPKIIIEAFIRCAGLDKWAMNVLWSHFNNNERAEEGNGLKHETEVEEVIGQDMGVHAATVQEERGVGTDLSLYELETKLQETGELQKKLVGAQEEKKELQ